MKELRPVFWVAIGVVVVGTVTGSVLDRVHRVAADEQAARALLASDQKDGTQLISLSGWGVHFSLPLAKEMPLVNFAVTSPDTVGLSSVDLVKLNVACSASQNGLGALLRYPIGTFGVSSKLTTNEHLIATIGAHEYVYQMPTNQCATNDAVSDLINQEEAVVIDGLSSLAEQPAGQAPAH